MGQLVFQATLGGQVNLVGPNTASTFNINVPAVAGNMVTTGDTGTVTSTMLATSVYTAPGTIGSGTANSGAFTTLSASSTVSGTGFSTYLASPPAIGGTTAAAGTFTSLTDSGNLTFTGTSNRITGDFSNATDASKVLFQTSTATSATILGVIPNGAVTSTGLYFFNDPSTLNCGRLDIGLLSGGTEARISSTRVGTGTYLPMTFLTGGSERMRIDTSGNVLVGATAATNAGKVISFFNSTTNVGLVSNDTSATAGATYFIASNNGTNIGSIARVGATSTVVYNTTSDQRLKSNITDSNAVLPTLMNVKVRQFDWTDGEVHQDYGFIAQELEPVLSGIVTKGKTKEDTWQLDYSRLTPHLVKAIQELKAIVDTQAAKIAALEAK